MIGSVLRVLCPKLWETRSGSGEFSSSFPEKIIVAQLPHSSSILLKPAAEAVGTVGNSERRAESFPRETTAGPLSQLAWHKIRFERTDSGIDILGANPGLSAEESAVGRREKSGETVSDNITCGVTGESNPDKLSRRIPRISPEQTASAPHYFGAGL